MEQERRHLDLAALVERLRGAGLRTDTRQFLAANELLLAYASRSRDLSEDPEALVSHLAPIFCSAPQDRQIFRDELLASLGAAPAPAPTEATVSKPRRKLSPILSLSAALLAIALAIIPVFHWYWSPHDIEGSVETTQPDGGTRAAPDATLVFRNQPVPIDPRGHFRLAVSRKDGAGELTASLPQFAALRRTVEFDTPSPIEIILDPQEPDAAPAPQGDIGPAEILSQGQYELPAPTGERVPWEIVIGGALAAAAFCFLALLLLNRSRRELALKRLTGQAKREVPLAPSVPPLIDIPLAALRRIAVGLRRTRADSVVELSIVDTVDATARAAGFVSPAFVPRRSTPEYLVLIDRRGPDDHHAHTMHRWFEQLRAHGVVADCYDFNADARVCSDSSGRQFRLPSLLARHHRATLLLCCETTVCLDSTSGAPHDWTRWLHALSRTALLTLEPPNRWSHPERALVDAGFLVLPASVDGLMSLASMGSEWRQRATVATEYARPFPNVIAHDPARWLDRNAPADATVAELLRALRGFLGPSGYAWLCACAIYPQISWPITLALLPALSAEDELARKRVVEKSLPSLARLPWFRYGYMPDWLRRVLIASLPADRERAVRALLEQWVYGLQSAGRGRATLGIGTWLTPHDIASAAPPGSPLSDRVFLSFIAQGDPDPLALRLASFPPGTEPRRRNLLEYVALKWRSFNLRAPGLVRAGGAVIAGLAAFLALRVALQPAPTAADVATFDYTYTFEQSNRGANPNSSPLSVVAPNGSFIARGNPTPAVDISDSTGSILGVSPRLDGPVDQMVISPDSRWIAIYAGGRLSVLQVATRRLFLGPSGGRFVRFSGDSRHLAVVRASSGVILELESRREVGTLPSMRQLAFSPVGNIAATADDREPILLWDTTTWQQVGTIASETPTRVTDLDFSLDGRYLAAANEEFTRIWDVEAKRQTAQLPGRGEAPQGLVSGPGARFIAYSADYRPLNMRDVDGPFLFQSERHVFGSDADKIYTLRLIRSADDTGRVRYEIGRRSVNANPPEQAEPPATVADAAEPPPDSSEPPAEALPPADTEQEGNAGPSPPPVQQQEPEAQSAAPTDPQQTGTTRRDLATRRLVFPNDGKAVETRAGDRYEAIITTTDGAIAGYLELSFRRPSLNEPDIATSATVTGYAVRYLGEAGKVPKGDMASADSTFEAATVEKQPQESMSAGALTFVVRVVEPAVLASGPSLVIGKMRIEVDIRQRAPAAPTGVRTQ